MTPRYFTPRDVALDLARRTQFDRMRVTGDPSGHPLAIACAIRSLAAIRGRDPGRRDLVSWESASPFSPMSTASAAGVAAASFVAPSPFVVPPSVVSQFARSAMIPRSPGAFLRSASLGAFRAVEPAPGQDASASWPSEPESKPSPAAEATASPSGTWRVVDPWPVAMPAGAQTPSPAGPDAASAFVQRGLAPMAGGAARSPNAGGANVVPAAPRRSVLAVRAGKFLNVAVKLEGMPEKLGHELRQAAKQVAESVIGRVISMRGG